MRQVAIGAGLAWLLACAGCFLTAPPKIDEPTPTPIARPKAPPAVMPDDINAQNVNEKLKAFTEELDFAAQHGSPEPH